MRNALVDFSHGLSASVHRSNSKYFLEIFRIIEETTESAKASLW
jgi:hypothetical protein